jgi:hypothetical protein
VLPHAHPLPPFWYTISHGPDVVKACRTVSGGAAYSFFIIEVKKEKGYIRGHIFTPASAGYQAQRRIE